MTVLIGIDVGGTNLRLGVVDITTGKPCLIDEMRFQADFSTLCKANQHSPKLAWQEILNTLASAIQVVVNKHTKVLAVGIGFPGFIDPNTQRISQSPNLPGLSHVDLSADLSQMLSMPVITENDALAAAYGEFVMQNAKSDQDLRTSHLIYLGLGTGVGGGLILNGQPFQGQHGVAMEAGHIIVRAQAQHPDARLCGCGNFGCMEQYASASGVALSYFESTGKQCNAHEIAMLAATGDVPAKAAYALAGTSLAQALAHILKVVDVADIVIGGGMSAGWAHMEQAFTQQLDQDLIPALRGKIKVNISNMGDQAGMIGAALLAAQKL